jgi:hypothetical protein
MKIMKNIFMYNKFKYLGKIKDGDRSVITNRETTAFFIKQEQQLPASIGSDTFSVIS